MAAWLRERGAGLVVLAGYMQILSPAFLAAFPQRVVNVHPALLPAFPGLRAVEQALAYGVKVFGVTVHFVDDGVDTGPIIFQRAVELPHATDPQEVRDALRPLEHDLLTAAVRAIARSTTPSSPPPSGTPPAAPSGSIPPTPAASRYLPRPMEAMVQPGEVRV